MDNNTPVSPISRKLVVPTVVPTHDRSGPHFGVKAPSQQTLFPRLTSKPAAGSGSLQRYHELFEQCRPRGPNASSAIPEEQENQLSLPNQSEAVVMANLKEQIRINNKLYQENQSLKSTVEQHNLQKEQIDEVFNEEKKQLLLENQSLQDQTAQLKKDKLRDEQMMGEYKKQLQDLESEKQDLQKQLENQWQQASLQQQEHLKQIQYIEQKQLQNVHELRCQMDCLNTENSTLRQQVQEVKRQRALDLIAEPPAPVLEETTENHVVINIDSQKKLQKINLMNWIVWELIYWQEGEVEEDKKRSIRGGIVEDNSCVRIEDLQEGSSFKFKLRVGYSEEEEGVVEWGQFSTIHTFTTLSLQVGQESQDVLEHEQIEDSGQLQSTPEMDLQQPHDDVSLHESSVQVQAGQVQPPIMQSQNIGGQEYVQEEVGTPHHSYTPKNYRKRKGVIEEDVRSRKYSRYNLRKYSGQVDQQQLTPIREGGSSYQHSRELKRIVSSAQERQDLIDSLNGEQKERQDLIDSLDGEQREEVPIIIPQSDDEQTTPSVVTTQSGGSKGGVNYGRRTASGGAVNSRPRRSKTTSAPSCK